MLPKGWVIRELGEVSDFLDGKRKPIKSEDRNARHGPFPYYGATGIIDWLDDYIFDEPLILMGEDGENIISRVLPHVFKVEGKIWVNNHAHVIKPKQAADIDFLVAYLESLDYGKFNTGTAQPKLNQRICSGIPVLLPPLAEQLKIARILSTWDHAVAVQKRLIANARGQKKALTQALLTNENRLPRSSTAWQSRPLGDLARIYDGTHMTPDYVESGVPFYSVEHLTSGNFSDTKFVSETVFLNENRRVSIERNDILMTRIGDIGTAKLIDWDVRASFYVSLALIKPGKNIRADYLAHYISGAKFSRELHKRTIHVAFPKKINLGEISNCLVDFPSLPEQEKIAAALSACDSKIASYEKLLAETREEKSALIQQLLTGKRRVKFQDIAA